MKRKKNRRERRFERNVYGNVVDSTLIRAERVVMDVVVPMVLMPTADGKISKRSKRDSEKDDRKMNWNAIPTTDDLQTKGMYDRVEAIARDMDKWSLFGLKKWRKPLNDDHVKRTQRKLKRMFLRSSTESSISSSSSSRSHNSRKSIPSRSPKKITPRNGASHNSTRIVRRIHVPKNKTDKMDMAD
jgi:hypothetical protein